MSDTDAIVKVAVLRAPPARVWSAVEDSEAFGTWFGCRFEAPFVVGQRVRGVITEPETFAGQPFEIEIVAIEPKRRLAFHWHVREEDLGAPFEPGLATLVELILEEVDHGTRLTIRESGFDAVPEALRATTFRRNEGGWLHQIGNLTRHVGG